MELSTIKCKFFFTLNAFKRSIVSVDFSLFFEVYYGIVVICTFLGQLLVASVSLLSCSICFVAHVTLSCFRENKLMMKLMMKSTGIFCTCVPKNETYIILNIVYSCKSVAMKFSTRYPDGLSY